MSIVLPLHSAPPPKVEVPQYEGEMPDDDVDDDPDAQPPETSIPDPQNMDAIPGYNNVGFSGGEYFELIKCVLIYS